MPRQVGRACFRDERARAEKSDGTAGGRPTITRWRRRRRYRALVRGESPAVLCAAVVAGWRARGRRGRPRRRVTHDDVTAWWPVDARRKSQLRTRTYAGWAAAAQVRIRRTPGYTGTRAQKKTGEDKQYRATLKIEIILPILKYFTFDKHYNH